MNYRCASVQPHRPAAVAGRLERFAELLCQIPGFAPQNNCPTLLSEFVWPLRWFQQNLSVVIILSIWTTNAVISVASLPIELSHIIRQVVPTVKQESVPCSLGKEVPEERTVGCSNRKARGFSEQKKDNFLQHQRHLLPSGLLPWSFHTELHWRVHEKSGLLLKKHLPYLNLINNNVDWGEHHQWDSTNVKSSPYSNHIQYIRTRKPAAVSDKHALIVEMLHCDTNKVPMMILIEMISKYDTPLKM